MLLFYTIIFATINVFNGGNEYIIVLFGLSLIFIWFCFFPLPKAKIIIWGIGYFFILKIYYLFTLDPLTGLDAERYYALTQSFSSLRSFLQFTWYDVITNGLIGADPFATFGLIFMPFYRLIGINSTSIIVLINSILVISSIFFWYKVNKKHLVLKELKIDAILLIGFLFFSTSLSYWSSVFLKDITSLFLVVMAVYFLLERKYIRAFLFLYIASAFRIYSIVIVFCYYVFIKQKPRIAFLGLVGSLLIVAYEIGFTGVINVFVKLVNMLFSPIPLDINNWKVFPLQTLESLIIFIIIVLSVFLFMLKRQSRRFLVISMSAILIYSCVMTLIGYIQLHHLGMDYNALSGGDNFARKRLPMVLIIYTILVYTIQWFNKKETKP